MSVQTVKLSDFDIDKMRYDSGKTAQEEHPSDSQSLFDIEQEPPMSNVCSLLLAGTAGGAANYVMQRTIQTPVYNAFQKAMKGTPRNNNFKKFVQCVFQESSLAEKGCKMLNHKEIKEYAKPVKTSDNASLKQCLTKIIGIFKHPSTDNVLKGKDAFYNNFSKEIAVNTNKNAITSFHEMGHALNYNTKGIGNVLSKLKWPAYITLILVGLCAYRKKKPEGETSDSIIGKGMDFAKEHCVGITAATTIPTLLEEGLASIKGYKLAKNKLPSAQLKNMSNLYGKAWMTYLASSVISVGVVYVIDKVRNLTTGKA